MKIILLKDIKNLGSFSSKITIKSGFGRNYLLKKNKAIRATPQNKFFFLQEEQKIKIDYIKNKNNAIKDLEYLNKKKIFYYLINSNKEGKLYGAISKKDIIKSLITKLTTKKIELYIPKKIKYTGTVNINICLYPNLNTNIKLIVGKNQKEVKHIHKSITE